MKNCTKCTRTLSLEAFRHRHKRGKLGPCAVCKDCERVYRESIRTDNEKIPYGSTEWGTSGSRKCVKCKMTKMYTEFAKDRNRKLGIQAVCRSCNVVVRHKLRDKTYKWRIKETYGITIETLRGMYAEQNGQCAICKRACPLRGSTATAMHIDHDHATGKVRGLLCGQCNGGLGYFKDSTDSLRNAISYLDGHK